MVCCTFYTFGRRQNSVATHLPFVIVAVATVFLAQNVDAHRDFNEGHAASASTWAFAATIPFVPISTLVDSVLGSHVTHSASSRS